MGIAPARQAGRSSARALALACLVATGAGFPLRGAHADGDAPALSNTEVPGVVQALRAGLGSKDPAARRRAVFEHGRRPHEAVAEVLAKRVAKESDPGVLEEIFVALATQRPSASRLVPAVTRWIDGMAAEEEARFKRGDPGFPVDPRTGDPALETAEGRAALDRMEARARALHEAIRCLRSLYKDAPPSAATWTALLRDPHDPLVIEVLGALAAWGTRAALPALLDLFRCYPEANRWATGAVTDLAGDDASARRTWIVLFGHPNKHRARPEVHAALAKALTTLTGRSFDDPAALDAWLRDHEPKKPARREKASR